MADVQKDYIVHGPPLEYEGQYTSVGKFIFECLQSDPAFVGQIEAHTGHKYTFAEILDRSIRLALWLRDMDIKSGDVVSYVTQNHKDVIIVVYATLFVGAVLSPWDATLNIQDIAHFMYHTKPKIVICSNDAAILVKTAAGKLNATPVFVVHGELSGFISFEDTQIHSKREIDDFQCTEMKEDDTAFLVCTSGTSALPKIMQRTHKSILIRVLGTTKNKHINSTFLTMAPLCWVSGLQATMMGLTDKSQRVVASYFDEQLVWKWVEKYQVKTIFTIPCPIFLRIIFDDAVSRYDISSLQTIVTAGSLLRPWHYEKFKEIAPAACKLMIVYGITEMGGVVSTNIVRSDNSGSCGTFVPGQSGKIIDIHTGEIISPYEVGELCLKSPKMFTGYYNDPALTKLALDSDGWFHTADVAKFNKKGELFVIDRLKDIIYVNGLIVSPSELEAILLKHPEVEKVGVVGKKVSSNVEHPVAFVVRTFGSSVKETELCDFLEAQVTDDAKKLRGGVRFIDKMPCSTSGKIKRWELRHIVASET